MGAAVDRLVANKSLSEVWRVYHGCTTAKNLEGKTLNGVRDIANPQLFDYADHFDGKKLNKRERLNISTQLQFVIVIFLRF
jgi:hypothetical protein